MAATFDTLKYANTLKAGGVPPAQAEAQAVALSEAIQVNFKDLATKDDVAALGKDLRHEIKEAEQRLNAKIDGTAARLDAKIDGTAARLGTDIQVLATQHRADMARLTWMLGVIITGTAGILVRLFVYGGRP